MSSEPQLTLGWRSSAKRVELSSLSRTRLDVRSMERSSRGEVETILFIVSVSIGGHSRPVGDSRSPVGDNRSPVGDSRSPVEDNRSPVGDNRSQ